MTPTDTPWHDWIGREEQRADTLGVTPVAAMSATLDRDDPAPVAGVELPPLWHWLYFLPQTLARDIGADGHARRGGFLPPVPLPRRMWAGSRLRFERPLHVGDAVTRTSRIASVSSKAGKTGPLVFVCVHHRIADPRGVAWTEEHDIVYRELPAPGTPGAPVKRGTPAPRDEQFARRIEPDPVLLFRYSALTFNGHRIHYDRSYVTEVEGYPGLIVHGPLIATLLLDLLRRERPAARVRGFEFKALSPLFDIHPFEVCGKAEADGRFALWARDHQGALAMQATAHTA